MPAYIYCFTSAVKLTANRQWLVYMYSIIISSLSFTHITQFIWIIIIFSSFCFIIILFSFYFNFIFRNLKQNGAVLELKFFFNFLYINIRY
jgi:hypothetical protein